MSSTRIERVLRHDGIVAVLDISGGDADTGDISWVGDDDWRPIVMEAVKLRQIAREPSVRVLVGDHAVLISGDEKKVVGVVFIKGHPVVKSVVRMVRQLLRAPAPAKTVQAPAAAPTAAQQAPANTAAPAPTPQVTTTTTTQAPPTPSAAV